MKAYAYRPKSGLELPFCETPQFNVFMGVVIMFNAVLIYLDTDQLMKQSTIDLIGDVLLYIYIIEMAFRVFYLGGLGYISDAFNVLDGALVIFGIIEKIFLGQDDPGATEGGAEIPGGSTMRVLRLLRLARLTRLLRLVRYFEALWTAVVSTIRVFETLLSVLPILLLAIYALSLLTSMLIGGSTQWIFTDRDSPGEEFFDNEKYFGTVGSSMLTLFQVFTLSGWGEICRRITVKYPQVLVCFVFFIFMISFGLGNVIIASVCYTSIKHADADRAQKLLDSEERNNRVAKMICNCFASADQNSTGVLNLTEVRNLIMQPDITKALKSLGVQIHDAEAMLKLLDKDGDNTVSRAEFITGFLQFLGIGSKNSLNRLLLQLQALTIRGNLMHRRFIACKRRLRTIEDNFAVAFLAFEGEIEIRKEPLAERNRERRQAAKGRLNQNLSSGPPSCDVSIKSARDDEARKRAMMLWKPSNEDDYGAIGKNLLPSGVPKSIRDYRKQKLPRDGLDRISQREMQNRLRMYTIEGIEEENVNNEAKEKDKKKKK